MVEGFCIRVSVHSCVHAPLRCNCDPYSGDSTIAGTKEYFDDCQSCNGTSELTYDKVRDALETAGETEDRNIEKEKFEEKIN